MGANNDGWDELLLTEDGDQSKEQMGGEKEDDFYEMEDDLKDEGWEEPSLDDQGTCMMGPKDPKDASQDEDLVLHPPSKLVVDRSGQDVPDLSRAILTPRENILFPSAEGTTRNVVPAAENNSFVQSGPVAEEQECMHPGMTDKELPVVSMKVDDGGWSQDDEEAGTGDKEDTMTTLMLPRDVVPVTPSSGPEYHHTDKSTQYHITNTMVLAVPGGSRDDAGRDDNPIADPVPPPPSQDDHPGTNPPPPPTHPAPKESPDDDTPSVSSIQTPPRTCSHDEKGICARHGVKGKLRWKLLMKTTSSGEKEKTRLYFYTCDKNKGDRRQLIQQRLYFKSAKTPKDVEDTRKRGDEDTL